MPENKNYKPSQKEDEDLFWNNVDKSYEALKNDPEAWAQELKEREETGI